MKTGLGRGLGALINPNFNKESLEEKIAISDSEIMRDDGESVDILSKIPTEEQKNYEIVQEVKKVYSKFFCSLFSTILFPLFAYY